jgi:glycine/sarcosine N-methyltransferase
MRPFYGRFAWAYDALVERPVSRECAYVAAALAKHGVAAGARVLDAGCGTGRYAAELAGHGYRVTGVDLAPALVAVARQRGGTARFAVGDLAALPFRAVCGAALCRGVLNDVLADDGRRAVMAALAGVLADRGVLVLDVRDWDATVRRKTLEPVHERTVETERGTLTFRSETRLDPATRRLLVSERHVLVTRSGTESEAYEFVMRGWTRGELDARLHAAGLVLVELRGAYDDAVPAGATDRLVAIAAAARRVC